MRVAALLLLCLWGAETQAAPDNGFGVYAGLISSKDAELYGNSSGGLVQADVQFMVNDHWSLNPYLLFASESTTHSLNVQTTEGGLQVRYWMGSVFVAGQLLSHDNLFRQGSTVSGSFYGPGAGFAAGWDSDSHWSVSLAANAYHVVGGYGQAGTTRSEAMLLIGYHWY